MAAAASAWLKRFSTGSPGSPRLFCVPYAGGGPAVFRTWPRLLPPGAGVYGIRLPGRELRLAEPAFEELPPLVEELTPILADEVPGSPYVFFGHSLGALIAFAVCREFRRNGTALPGTLIVSGAKAPHLPHRKPPIHDLPEPEFIEELRRMEGTPEEALANKELMDVLIPMLRADCSVSETYNHTEEPPLPCRIVAFGGQDDEDVPVEDVEAWSVHTGSGFEHRIFPGGHFFMHSHETDVVNEVTKHLRTR